MRTDQGSWRAPTVVLATGGGRGRARAAPARAAACRPGSPRSTAADYRNPGRAPGRRRAGRRRLGQRGPDRRRAAPLRAAGDAGRRRARADAADLPGPRHPVVDGRLGRARRALRRGRRTWCGRATCRRCSWSARRSGTLDLNALGRLGVRLVGRLAGRPRRDRPSSPARCPTCARWPTSSWAGCWTRIDAWADRAGVDGRAAAAVRADRGARARAAVGDLRPRRDRIDRLGDRLPARPVLARRPGVRPQGPGRPRRRRHRRARPVPDRPAVPAPPQVHADRRRRRRDAAELGRRTSVGHLDDARPPRGRAEEDVMQHHPVAAASPPPSPAATRGSWPRR